MLYKTALLVLFAAVAAAVPIEEENLTSAPSSGSNGKITLLPKVHPDVDRSNVNNLAASHDSKLAYDSDPHPEVDSTVATVSAPNATYPIVQLENSQYINSTNCTTDQAHIAFNNRTAFDSAVQDWSQHSQFVIISYSASCGSGFAHGKRDFAVVSKIHPDTDAMIVDADIQFISYVDAIGNKTMIHAAIGQYSAPVSKRWDISKTLSLNWNEYPTNSLSTNRWGSGYQLLQSSKLDVICVGCGTQGDLSLTGEVDFSFFGGFDSAKLSLTGTMQGQLAMGLVANGISGNIPIASHQLAQIPIGGVEIPDIVSLGPQIDISVGASVNIKATGTLLLGAKLSWSNIDVELGLSGDNTQSGNGLTPSITPMDSVQGSITATLDLHLPVSVGIGINILDGTWNKSLAIVDTPGFQLSATASNDPGACTGIELSADVYNNVGVDILEITTFGLATWTYPFWSTCLFGSTGSPTPTPNRSPTGPGSTWVRPTYTTTRTVRKSSPGTTPTYTASPTSTYTPKPPATTPKPTYTTKAPPPPKTYTTRAPPPPKSYTTKAPPPPKSHTTKAPPPPKTYTTKAPPPPKTYTTKAPPPPKTYTTKAPPPPKSHTTKAPPPPQSYTAKPPPPPPPVSPTTYPTYPTTAQPPPPPPSYTTRPTPGAKKRVGRKPRRG